MLGTEELHAELEKGYADMKAGRTTDAKTVLLIFAKIMAYDFNVVTSIQAEEDLR